MENGVVKPNVHVILTSKISAADFARLNLGYLDPAKIDVESWKNRVDEGILYVPRAGESRLLSALKSERIVAAKVLGSSEKFTIDKDALVGAAEQVLSASKITSYAQGLSLLKMASQEYNWNIDLSLIVPVCRAGCIICVSLLRDITNAYRRNPDLPNLLLDDAFKEAVISRQPAWRSVLQTAVGLGIPMLATSASLAYFDAYRSAILPANLTQARRNYFGAHNYRRVDKEGVFHTQWEG